MTPQKVNYDEISKIYDDVREGDIVLINHFLQELPACDGLIILDIGCGTGNYTDLFQRVTQPKQHRIHGVEPSEGMIGKARQKNSQIQFHQASSDHIPSEDNFFDFIYMTDVIHHIPDLRAMFSEVHRILKPGGKVCIVTQSHRQIMNRPIVQFFPGTAKVDKERYPDIDKIIAIAQLKQFVYLKQEVVFEGESVELGRDFLQLVQKKGYSMLHLLTEQEYQAGLARLEHAMLDGSLQSQAAGETLVWFTKK